MMNLGEENSLVLLCLGQPRRIFNTTRPSLCLQLIFSQQLALALIKKKPNRKGRKSASVSLFAQLFRLRV